MTIYQYAVVQIVYKLMEERKTRPLTRKEEQFLVRADGTVGRIKRQEQHDQIAPRYSSHTGN